MTRRELFAAVALLPVVPFISIPSRRPGRFFISDEQMKELARISREINTKLDPFLLRPGVLNDLRMIDR